MCPSKVAATPLPQWPRTGSGGRHHPLFHFANLPKNFSLNPPPNRVAPLQDRICSLEAEVSDGAFPESFSIISLSMWEKARGEHFKGGGWEGGSDRTRHIHIPLAAS